MGIWIHTHTVTFTNISPPDLGELAEIQDGVRVKTMPLCYYG